MKSITVNIYYTGKNGSAKQYVEEMLSSGLVEQIKAEKGNLKYDYFYPAHDEETVLLIDRWENQEALDMHHASSTMAKIVELRKKYNLSMRAEKYIEHDEHIDNDDKRYVIR